MPDEREEGGVRVSNRAIYEMLMALRFEVADLKKDLQVFQDKQRENTKRIRALELRFYGIMAGGVAACMTLLKIGGVL